MSPTIESWTPPRVAHIYRSECDWWIARDEKHAEKLARDNGDVEDDDTYILVNPAEDIPVRFEDEHAMLTMLDELESAGADIRQCDVGRQTKGHLWREDPHGGFFIRTTAAVWSCLPYGMLASENF